VEKLAMKQYSANLAKGKEIIEYYVNELMSEGITNIPMWTESLAPNPSQESTTISITEDPSLIAARRRLSSQDASNIFTSSSPPNAAAIAAASASNFSALSDELESFQIDEHLQEKRGKFNLFKSSLFFSVIDDLLAVGNIDDEYIRRYVGQLDPFEESSLVQLRKWVGETHKGKVRNTKNKTISFDFFSYFSYPMILIYFVFFVLVDLTLKKPEKVFAIH
jgi:hypothetical protein